MARYEKVNANTVRVIKEQATEVDMTNLLKAKTQMISDIERLKANLKSLEEVIVEAEKLGITPLRAKEEKEK